MSSKGTEPKGLQAILAQDKSLTEKVSYNEFQDEANYAGMDYQEEDAYEAYCEFCKKELSRAE